jgi:RNA polymerase-binding transcription factor DksA
MLMLEPVTLELSQADAVSRALLADAAFRESLSIRQVCLGCGRAVDRARLVTYPKATRCSLCVGIPCLARRR